MNNFGSENSENKNNFSKPNVLRNTNPRKSPCEDNHNSLLEPPINSHIVMIYENQFDLDIAIISYINEGLRKVQRCIHASVRIGNKDYAENLSANIIEYKKNIENGNLILVDLSRYYIDALTDNFQQLDKLKEDIMEQVSSDDNRKDKNIRITADCATVLMKNRYFEECINLESWWHQRPFKGSYLCPYPKLFIDKFPYSVYLFRLFYNHNIVIDSNGKIIPELMNTE